MAFSSKFGEQTIFKIIIQLLLFGLFLYFFGEPAFRQYLDRKVLIVKSRRDTKGIPAPAVTIVALNRTTQCGWKEECQLGCAGIVQTLCNDANSTDSFANCIQKYTYKKGSPFLKCVASIWALPKSL